MSINKGSLAIVLIEFQKQWTEKGFYYRLIERQLKSRKVLENTHRLIKNARDKGIAVIHAPLIIDPKNKKGWLAHLTRGKVFTKGSWKSEITEGLYERGDLIVEGRYSFDAFKGSDFEELLKNNCLETLYFCGFTTDQCVAKTMKAALDKGYKCYLVSDCTAATNEAKQKKIEKKFHGIAIHHQDILSATSKRLN
jgi:nicotinamidase-related amidase